MSTTAFILNTLPRYYVKCYYNVASHPTTLTTYHHVPPTQLTESGEAKSPSRQRLAESQRTPPQSTVARPRAPESPQEAADSASAWDEVLSFLSSPNTTTATVKALFERGGVSVSQLVEGMNGIGIEVSDDQREAFTRSETPEKEGEVSSCIKLRYSCTPPSALQC